VVVSVEELRMRIERRLENLSGEVERLRAALEALGPGASVPAARTMDRTPRPPGRGRRETATPGVTQAAARGLTDNGRGLTAAAIAMVSGPQWLATPAAFSSVVADSVVMSGEREDVVAQVSAIDPAAGAGEGEAAAPTRGADRALQGLRSELSAALRNGRI
jgi:hypothetical protein